MSKFSKFVSRLQKSEHYSKDSATRIAAVVGARNYGWEGMAERAAASRKAHEEARRA